MFGSCAAAPESLGAIVVSAAMSGSQRANRARARDAMRGGRRRDGYQAPCTARPRTASPCAQFLAQPAPCLPGPYRKTARGDLCQRPRRQPAQRPVPLAAEHVPGRRCGRAGDPGGDRGFDGRAGERGQLHRRHRGPPAQRSARAPAACRQDRRPALGRAQDRQTGDPQRRGGDEILHPRRYQAAARQSRIHSEQVLRAAGGAAWRRCPRPRRRASRRSIRSSCTPTRRRSRSNDRPGCPAGGRRPPAGAERHPPRRGWPGDWTPRRSPPSCAQTVEEATDAAGGEILAERALRVSDAPVPQTTMLAKTTFEPGRAGRRLSWPGGARPSRSSAATRWHAFSPGWARNPGRCAP